MKKDVGEKRNLEKCNNKEEDSRLIMLLRFSSDELKRKTDEGLSFRVRMGKRGGS